MTNVFCPHSEKQERALFSEKPILLLGTGTQYGKTLVGALRMAQKMLSHVEKGSNFIVTAPTYKVLHQATLPAFLKFMGEYGKYSGDKEVFTTSWGTQCFFRTGTDPDSVVGIPDVEHIWCDEAGKYSLYFWENIRARAASHGCQIDLTTSPYALNWIYKDLIKPVRRGDRDDVEFISAASWENPYHSLHNEEARIREQATMDPRRFRMIYGGEWGRMEGLVYDCWDDDVNLVEPFELPHGTKFWGGIDWGYSHPFVVKIRAILPNGKHIGVSEFYKRGMTLTRIKDVVKRKMDIWGVELFFCDPSEPGYIEELNLFGIPAVKADNDITRGISLHYDLIKSGMYQEFRGSCPNSLDEREVYHYPEEKDLKPDQDDKEQKPVDADNHAMDVDRYLTIETYGRTKNSEAKVPTATKKFKNRLEYLKKSYLEHEQTESWS